MTFRSDTNYDLKSGSVTIIKESGSKDSERILVESTVDFPESGNLTVGGHIIGAEVLSYSNKTQTSFEGLKRGVYDSRLSDLPEGFPVTSFDERCLSEEQLKKSPLPLRSIRSSVKDMNSPLMRQRSSDIFTAVVRLPDRPFLWRIGEDVELIPGENHWETYGYHIFKDGEKITQALLRPGTTFTLPEAGTYSAMAVEWSGLKSMLSLPLQVNSTAALKVRWDKPADFSWTYDRWLVDGKEVDIKKAEKSVEAVKEIIHLLDGVIHREWYNWGQIKKRYDLNDEGKPIRRLFYKGVKLSRREFYNRDGVHISTEIFDSYGYITESIQYQIRNGKSVEVTHWWYEKAMPVKLIGNAGKASPEGAGVYMKEGEKWVKQN